MISALSDLICDLIICTCGPRVLVEYFFSTGNDPVLYFPKAMNLVSLVTAALVGSTCLTATGVSRRSLTPASPKRLVETRVRVPLAFEPNVGQAASEVRWISRTPDRTFLLTASEAVMLLKAGNETDAIKMRMIGGRSNPATEGIDKLNSTSNYFMGANADQWRTAVPPLWSRPLQECVSRYRCRVSQYGPPLGIRFRPCAGRRSSPDRSCV